FADYETGRFELADLAPGDYVLHYGADAARSRPDRHVVEYSGDVVRIDDATPLTLAPGQALTGADVDRVLGGEIVGTVGDRDGRALPLVHVIAQRLVGTPEGTV